MFHILRSALGVAPRMELIPGLRGPRDHFPPGRPALPGPGLLAEGRSRPACGIRASEPDNSFQGLPKVFPTWMAVQNLFLTPSPSSPYDLLNPLCITGGNREKQKDVAAETIMRM